MPEHEAFFMAPNVHPAASVEDALAMLDCRVPLTSNERKLIVQGLWDAAFRSGARQGRLAGIEAEKKRLGDLAANYRIGADEVIRLRRSEVAGLLESIADIEAFEETVDILRDPEALAAIAEAEAEQEYEEPTATIRRRLERIACEKAAERLQAREQRAKSRAEAA